MPWDYSVRVSRPEDEQAVIALLEASYPRLMGERYGPAEVTAALPTATQVVSQLLSTETYYVAESGDGRIVGCGGWTAERPGTGKREKGLGHLRLFGTHPDWLRRGVGRAIYDRCETQARAAGVRRFECYASLNATAFYQALGFHAVREIMLPVAPTVSFASMVMERTV